MESCLAAGFERACGAVAVLEKLDVSNLVSFETRQEGEWRSDFLPRHVRFIGKRAEEGDAVALLDGVRCFEVQCFPEPLDGPKDSANA